MFSVHVVIFQGGICQGGYPGVPPLYKMLGTIIVASLSEPLSVELAGAFLWYILYIYICIHGQSIWSHVNAQRANVRLAE